MSQGPQYTSCVEPKHFSPPNTALIVALGVLIVGGLATALASFGVGALVAIASLVQLLRYVLNFMLNGKLVCLHRDPAQGCHCGNGGNTVCAIGEVADTENVGEDKNPIEDIDNDYGVNLMLAPFDIKKFAANGEDKVKNLALATDPALPQGDLLRLQPNMPLEDGQPMWTGYFRTMVVAQTSGEYHAWTELFGRELSESDQEDAWTVYRDANPG